MADVSNLGIAGAEAITADGTGVSVPDSDGAASGAGAAVITEEGSPAALRSRPGRAARIAVLRSKWRVLREQGTPLVKYLMESEVHTYAFSVAANAIISFIPLVVILYSVARVVFHASRSDVMTRAMNDLLVNFFPKTTSDMWLNIRHIAPHHIEVFSFVMILISCTGIFLPLEVALNQAWGVAKGRNLIMNQVVSMSLALLMVLLGVISVLLNTGGLHVLLWLSFKQVNPGDLFKGTYNHILMGIGYLWMALSSGAACILFFFAIYWALPNRKVPWRPVMRVSIVTGVCWLVAKYIVEALLPLMAPESLYGPFTVAVGLLFWSYISGLILFAGAQFSASRLVVREEAQG